MNIKNNYDHQSILREAEINNEEYKNLIKKLKKNRPKDLDKSVNDEHNLAFDAINCLTCANCCKTTSPMLFQNDIQRMARELKIKISGFMEKYVYQDDEGDFVFNSAPCPFLGSDNYCEIYDSRPKACREYPHTNRKRFYQLLNLTLKNSEICPAVQKIFDGLKTKYL